MFKFNFFLAIVVFALLLSGCAGGTQEVSAKLGEEFSLQIGQTALLTGENMKISFQEVITDSRCPRNVTCVWAGQVSCLVRINDSGSTYDVVLTQSGLTDQHAKETYKQYKLSFNTTPYPEAGKQIAPNEYKLLLTVSK